MLWAFNLTTADIKCRRPHDWIGQTSYAATWDDDFLFNLRVLGFLAELAGSAGSLSEWHHIKCSHVWLALHALIRNQFWRSSVLLRALVWCSTRETQSSHDRFPFLPREKSNAHLMHDTPQPTTTSIWLKVKNFTKGLHAKTHATPHCISLSQYLDNKVESNLILEGFYI